MEDVPKISQNMLLINIIDISQVLKTRLALGKTGEYRNIFDCAKQVVQRDGIRGFYRGLAPGLIGVIPYAGIDLCVYEVCTIFLFLLG